MCGVQHKDSKKMKTFGAVSLNNLAMANSVRVWSSAKDGGWSYLEVIELNIKR